MSSALQACLDEAGKVIKKQKICTNQSEQALQSIIDTLLEYKSHADVGRVTPDNTSQMLMQLQVQSFSIRGTALCHVLPASDYNRRISNIECGVFDRLSVRQTNDMAETMR